MALERRDILTTALASGLIVAISLVGMHVLSVQSARPHTSRAALAAYADVIMHLDSVFGGFQADTVDTSSVSPRGLAAVAAWHMSAIRQQGDFEIVVPPPRLESLHAQMNSVARDHLALVDTLEALEAGSIPQPDCGGRRDDLSLGCPIVVFNRWYYEVREVRSRSHKAEQRLVVNLTRYVESRGRAERLLAERGVTLPSPRVRLRQPNRPTAR